MEDQTTDESEPQKPDLPFELPDKTDQTFIVPKAVRDPNVGTIYSRFLSVAKPFGFEVRDDRSMEYHPLPYRPEEGDTLLLPQPWRIMLEMIEDDYRRVLGLDLYGDVILGRGDSKPGKIIVNLDPYNAQERGVSREHVMLRPTKGHLYAIDQGSTNGTTVNGASSLRGSLTGLRNEDILKLGNLMLMIHIVAKPNTAK